MACEDIKNKFQEIEGWEKVSDGRDAYTKLFKFSDFKIGRASCRERV